MIGIIILSCLIIIGNSIYQTKNLQAQQQTTVCCFSYDPQEAKIFFFRPADAVEVVIKIDGVDTYEAIGLNNYVQLPNPLDTDTYHIRGKAKNETGEWSVYGDPEIIVVL